MAEPKPYTHQDRVGKKECRQCGLMCITRYAAPKAKGAKPVVGFFCPRCDFKAVS